MQSHSIENIINTAQLPHRLQALITQTRKALQSITLSDIPQLLKEDNLEIALDHTNNLHFELRHAYDTLESLLKQEHLLSVKELQSQLDPLRRIKNTVNTVLKQQTAHIGYVNTEAYRAIHTNSLTTLLEQLDHIEAALAELVQPCKQAALLPLLNDQFSQKQLLNTPITLDLPQKVPTLPGREMDFMTDRIRKKPEPYRVTLNPLQYAAQLHCAEAVEQICQRLAAHEDPTTLGILGEYGAITLSYKNGSASAIVPIILNAFPQLTLDIAIEAIANNRHEIIEMVVATLGQVEELDQKQFIVQTLFNAALHASQPAEDLDTLLNKIRDAESPEALRSVQASLKAHCQPSETNMLLLLPLLSRPEISAIRNSQQQTLLHALCQGQYDLPHVAQRLLEFDGLGSQIDDAGNLALHYAVQHNHLDMAKHLTTQGHINRLNHAGKSPLHLAIEAGNPDMINMLFMAGCDMHQKTGDGLSPVALANDQELRHTLLLELQDQARGDIESLKTISNELHSDATRNRHRIKGLLVNLLESLEVYRLNTTPERSKQLDAATQQSSLQSVQDAQAAIRKAAALAEPLRKQAELRGVDELIHKTSRQSERLRQQANAIEQTARLVQHLSQPATERAIAPPATGKRKIKYLVANGGGAKGSTHIGAFQLVDVEELKGVAGTSAGGIFSLLVALKNSKEELREKLNNLDFIQFLDDSSRKLTKSVFQRIEEVISIVKGETGVVGKISTLRSLYQTISDISEHNTGLFKGEKFCNWICDEIIEKTRDTAILDRINVELDEHDHAMLESLNTEAEKEHYVLRKKAALVTFADLADPSLGDFLELKVYGTNIASKRSEEYSARKTPNMTILSALRITMSLPLIFKPAFIKERRDYVGKDGGTYHHLYQVDTIPKLDGGYFHNFPINAFDVNPHTGAELYNPDTLGLCLIPPAQYDEFVRNEIAAIDQVDEKSCLMFLLKMALAGIMAPQDIFSKRGHDLERTAYLNTYEHGTLDFNADALAKQDMENRCGRHGVLHYLGSHGHTLEHVSLSHVTRKRLEKNGLRKDFTHHNHLHGRLEPLHIVHPVEVLRLYAKATVQDLSLVRKLVNPNARDVNGLTALHLATALGMTQTAERLRAAQANPDSMTLQGARAAEASWAEVRDLVRVKPAQQKTDQLGMLPDYLFLDGDPRHNAEALFSTNAKTRMRDNHQLEAQILDDRIRELEEKIAAQKQLAEQRLAEQEQQARQRIATLQNRVAEKEQENAELSRRVGEDLKLEVFKQFIHTQVIAKLNTLADAQGMEASTQRALQAAGTELRDILRGDLEAGDAAGAQNGDTISALKTQLSARLNDIIKGEVPECKTLSESTGWRKFFGLLINLIFVGLPYMLSERHSVYFFKPRATALLDLKDTINNFEQTALTVR